MYLSKETIIKAYELLNKANPTILNNYSAIQYFVATDRFFKSNGTPCDSSDAGNRTEFYRNVEDVVSLDDGRYLSNFKTVYEGSKPLSSTVSSNFFNGSSVELSNNTSGRKFDYPKKEPLLYALDGKVYTEGSYYPNIDKYLASEHERVALVIWLLRKKDIFVELKKEEFVQGLAEFYTESMVDILIPKESKDWDKMKELFSMECSSDKAKITVSDISPEKKTERTSNLPLQQIFYGAPGTGKSREIKRLTKGEKVIRTTFHPDSDYSTFVGAYKPTMVEQEAMVVPIVLGGDGTRFNKNEGTYKEERIVYRFVMQAFLKAYLGAWKKLAGAGDDEVAPQFLIIEEINRGNCAQIFGDLFQLLDRGDNGFSEYPIEADNDLRKEIEKAFRESKDYKLENNIDVDDVVEDYTSNYDATLSEDIQNGRVLLLPSNLYIWATMNTSDQSLFPIDSAFKRRWDWKYFKIAEGRDSKTGELLNWTVKFNYSEDDKPYSFECSWWEFIKAINEKIASATSSDDKKLGYFFCKPEEKSSTIIDEERFVGKVVFYLWNDVFKDEENAIFKVNDSKGEPSFDAFYKEDEKRDTVVDTSALRIFLHNVFGENKELYKETVLSE